MVTDGESIVAAEVSATQADIARLRHLSVLRHPLPWRYVLLRAGVIWLVTRLLNVVLTLAFTTGTATQRLWHWYFWDAGWYIHIAAAGYSSSFEPIRAGYFPLYPMLMHIGIQMFPHVDVMVIALAVSNLGTLAALVTVGLLAAQERRSTQSALQAMLLLAASPLAVFLGGAYSDSLLIALVALALLMARRRQWAGAALASALATADRPFGMILMPALLIEYGSQHTWWWRLRTHAFTLARRLTWMQLGMIVLAPSLTLGSFMLVEWQTYGDPLAYVHTQDKLFGHAFRWPWQTLILAFQQLLKAPHWSYTTGHMFLDLLPVLFCLTVSLIYARRWPLSFTIYALASIAVCLTSPVISALGQFAVISDGRYMYGLVPVLLQIAAWTQRWPRWLTATLLITSLTLQAILTVFELRGGWLV